MGGLMNGLKRLYLGIEHEPRVVAAARALFYLLWPGLSAWLTYRLTGDPRVTEAVAVLVAAIWRVAEGQIDDMVKPEQNRSRSDAPPGDAG